MNLLDPQQLIDSEGNTLDSDILDETRHMTRRVCEGAEKKREVGMEAEDGSGVRGER